MSSANFQEWVYETKPISILFSTMEAIWVVRRDGIAPIVRRVLVFREV